MCAQRASNVFLKLSASKGLITAYNSYKLKVMPNSDFPICNEKGVHSNKIGIINFLNESGPQLENSLIEGIFVSSTTWQG